MVRIISALILAVTAVCASAAEPVQLVDNPPDRHVVVRGDTLWGISGKFLKEPWRWPEIWNMNREQIKNPHLIYPGEVVYLDRSGKNPRLRVGKQVKSAGGTSKLQPQIYSSAVQQAIPSIPPNQIEPFLSQPLVVEEGQLDNVPRIVAGPEYRGMMGNGDPAFATAIPDASVVNWNVFRPGKPLKDPDTGEVIGYEAFFLGNASLVQPGEPSVLQITVAKEEIMRGDRLLPASTGAGMTVLKSAMSLRCSATGSRAQSTRTRCDGSISRFRNSATHWCSSSVYSTGFPTRSSSSLPYP